MTGRASIGIDGFNLALEQGTGVATYARNLSYAIKACGFGVDVVYGHNTAVRADPLLTEIEFFVPPAQRRESLPGRYWRWFRSATTPAMNAVPIPLTGKVVATDLAQRLPDYDRLFNAPDMFRRAQIHFDTWGTPLKVRVPSPPAIMHWTYPLPVEMEGSRNIYTLHDLVPLRLPHTTLDVRERYLSLVRMIARRADHIVTVSEASKRDIIDLLEVDPARVTNTYQAARPNDPGRSEEEVRHEVADLLRLPYRDYFLFFGAIEPKKNVSRLIQAYFASRASTPLVLVGKRAWKSEEELAQLTLLNKRRAAEGGEARGQVIELDYMPASMLTALIRGAKAVVSPSLYEGFGLPALEAMQLGAAVITSTESSLPEIAGDAAVLVDPYDVADMAQALRRVDGDADLRAALSERAVRQAEEFSAKAYQTRLCALYARLGVSSS